MDNKLSELSKPVMYVVRTLDGSVASVKVHSYTAPKGFTSAPLYSQEYVSALDKVAQFWIGESAEWKKRAEDAEKRIAELEADLELTDALREVGLSQLKDAEQLNKKMRKSVRLPRHGFMTTGNPGYAKNDVIGSLKESGVSFTVDGDE
ncbi:hypothetical protein [Serratia quinivorans]|uniref:hypothetical protein n=1 Tax=Serratia quinivorans TaxID=137545 RepID=UPI003F718ABB